MTTTSLLCKTCRVGFAFAACIKGEEGRGRGGGGEGGDEEEG